MAADAELNHGWDFSAEAWIRGQGDAGDYSRRHILDPAIDRLLPDVAGMHILDVGCGEGRYCRVLRAKGATTVGIDPTSAFIQRAKALDPNGQYDIGAAEKMPYPDSSFDLTISYLSIIDIPDDQAATAEMVRVTKPGGSIYVVTLSNLASTTEGWVKDEAGNRLYRTVDRYMECFHLDLEWGGIRIRNYHRPLSRTINGFLSRGCVLTAFGEPLPAPDAPGYQDERRVPTFQILRFQRN